MKPAKKTAGPQPVRSMPNQEEAWRKKPLPKPIDGPRISPDPESFRPQFARDDAAVDWWSRPRD